MGHHVVFAPESTPAALAGDEDEKKSGPLSNWKSVGPNEWLIADENVWVRRVYDGQSIRDTIQRIHE